jgi:2-polyprenyl-6-methoxyphenol hydroxylase-like FAD-dependent oxidoreductase
MGRIIVLGGGVCGLTAGLLLARDGHEVTVLDRDRDPVPGGGEQAWEGWSRAGVIQFRQAHYLAPAGRSVLEEELPDVLDALHAAGAARFDAPFPGPDREQLLELLSTLKPEPAAP